MGYKRLNVSNEFNKLKTVLMAPTTEKTFLSQQNSLTSILLKHGVEIVWADIVLNAKYQLFVRDPFIVIGDKIILSYMKEKERQLELSGAEAFLSVVEPTKKIIIPHDIIIEGGDIIPHNEIIFVGQEGMRTNDTGLKFLKKKFSNEFNVLPIYMQFDKEKEFWLHLDCVFNPIWADTAIVFPDAIRKESLDVIESIFPNIIKITEQEKNELAANVLSIGNKTVIVQKRHKRIIKELKKNGFIIETINSYASIDLDGYSRCMTCPIERE